MISSKLVSRIICSITFLVFLLPTAVEARVKVQAEANPYSVFHPFEKFAWSALSSTHPRFDQYIRTEINSNFATKGFAQTTKGETPHFWISYRVKRKDVKDTVKEHEGHGIYTYETRKYINGTLILEILSPDQKQVMWRGWAGAKIKPGTSDKEAHKLITEAVSKLVKKLPR